MAEDLDELAVKQILKERLLSIEDALRQKLTTLRSSNTSDEYGLDEDRVANPEEDIRFAVVEFEARTAERIRRALARLESGEYGVCDDCRERIGKARLRAVPFASRCTECQEVLERKRQH